MESNNNSHRHLNLFSFFNQDEDVATLENNLSRAFAICLKNDPLILNEYLRLVLTKDDYENLFNVNQEDFEIAIDLQKNLSALEIETFSRVYAIAMSEGDLDMKGFLSQKINRDKIRDFTDVTIQIKNVLIVVEVKRTKEDCRAQLYSQVKSFKPEIVISKSISWNMLLNLLNQLKNVSSVNLSPSVYLVDFIRHIDNNFSHWFPSFPFSTMPFSADANGSAGNKLNKRLREGIAQSCAKYSLQRIDRYDRDGFEVDFGWASEVIPEFRNEEGDYLVCQVWPGNTKRQGYALYAKDQDLNWMKKKSLRVGGKEFPIYIEFEIKMSHFTKFVSNLIYDNPKKTLRKPLHTVEVHHKYSGKWQRNDSAFNWVDFEKFMDEHFVDPDFWRKKLDWQSKFLNTNRQNFTVTFGFIVSIYIPYSHLKEIDRKSDDIGKVASFLNGCVQAFEKLV